MRVKYVGDVVPHLTNQWVDVPDDLHLYQATSWIEVNLKEPEIDEADELSGHEMAQGFDESGPLELDPMVEMRERLDELDSRLAQPDVSKAADAVSSTARAIQSSFTVASELKAIEERALAQASINKTLSEEARTFSENASSERKKTTDLIAANQKIVNNAFNSYSGQMRALRENLAEADQEIRFLRQAASENSALLKKAGKIIKEWEARE